MPLSLGAIIEYHWVVIPLI